MSIIRDGVRYSNLEDQVRINQESINAILQSGQVLNEFGLKVVEELDYVETLPSTPTRLDICVLKSGTTYTPYIYDTAWIAGGTEDFQDLFEEKYEDEDSPYGLTWAVNIDNESGSADDQHYLLTYTRANATHAYDYMFNIGTFPMAGPQGIQGETGATGATGAKGDRGLCVLKSSIAILPVATQVAIASLTAGVTPVEGDIVIGKTATYSGTTGNFMFIVTSVDTTYAYITYWSYIPKGDAGADGVDGEDGEDGYSTYTLDHTALTSPTLDYTVLFSKIVREGTLQVGDFVIAQYYNSADGKYGIVEYKITLLDETTLTATLHPIWSIVNTGITNYLKSATFTNDVLTLTNQNDETVTVDIIGTSDAVPAASFEGTEWGDISGSISAQTDLYNMLANKEPKLPTATNAGLCLKSTNVAGTYVWGAGGSGSLTAGEGIDITDDVVSVKLDGTTLTKSSDGLKVTDNKFVPITRKVNGNELSSDVTLYGDTVDITSSEPGNTIKDYIDTEIATRVPTSRKINDNPLTSDITLTGSDIAIDLLRPTISIETYIDDGLDTCVKLTGNQSIAGSKTFSSNIGVTNGGLNAVNGSGTGYFYGNTNIKALSTGTTLYTYSFPSASGTLALTSDIPSLTNYVTTNTTQTISGAKTFTSNISLGTGVRILSNVNDSYVALSAGNTYTNGARLTLYGGSESASAGQFLLTAGDGTNSAKLVGKPDGTLKWDSNEVLTTNNGVTLTTAQTISGAKTFSSTISLSAANSYIAKTNTTGYMNLCGGTTDGDGAYLRLHGGTASANAGQFMLTAATSDYEVSLVGTKAGKLTWDSNEVLTTNNGVTLTTAQTISGTKTFTGNIIATNGIKNNVNTGGLFFWADTNSNTWMTMYGSNTGTNTGKVFLRVGDGTNARGLKVEPDGTFQFGNASLGYANIMRTNTKTAGTYTKITIDAYGVVTLSN